VIERATWCESDSNVQSNFSNETVDRDCVQFRRVRSLETSSVEVDGLSGDEREIANENESADGKYPDIAAAGVAVSRKASTDLDGEEAARIRVYGTQEISETLSESGIEIWI